MPELPEVENVALALRQSLLGRRLTGVQVRFAGVLTQGSRRFRRAVVGRELSDLHRHGKYLLLHFRGDGPGEGSRAVEGRAQQSGDPATAYLMIHLRMTGQFFIQPDYQPDKHVHLVLDFAGLPVYYRDIRKFGRFTLVDDGWKPSALAHVGPDMLDIRFSDWCTRVAGRRAPVKAVLLDQGVAAGLGNIYADEALYRARIHPERVPVELAREDLKRLLRAAKSILRQAIRHGGTTYLTFVNFHGRPGNFRQKLKVYGRTGEACRVCGSSIERVVVGGRSSHYCPICQPRRRGRRRRGRSSSRVPATTSRKEAVRS